jgi:methylenetetrahydrofolate dehydrogenase (NADP+)/methenyltetrahydrofolate cyclohydrolase
VHAGGHPGAVRPLRHRAQGPPRGGGRSWRGPTLGRPLSLLLTLKQPGANAAVTVVHSAVPDLADYTRAADIVVSAVGIASFILPDMVKPGVVAVGGGQTFQGRTALSDVDESVAEVASWVTPRLGGVGPTTVAMLLRNTVDAAERAARD